MASRYGENETFLQDRSAIILRMIKSYLKEELKD